MKIGLILGVGVWSLSIPIGACVDPFPHPTNLSELTQRIETLRHCLKIEGHGEETLSPLAWSFLQANDLREAENLFKSFSASPQFTPLDAVGYALTLLELGKGAEAHQWALRGTTGPWKAMAHFVEGRSLDVMGQPLDAISAFGRSLSADPLFAEVRPFRAQLRENQGATDDAWKDYDRVLSVDPRNPRAGVAKTALTPQLTKSASELVPRKKILNHHAVTAPPRESAGPILRVGLGTDGRGRSVILTQITLQCAGPFRWVDDQGSLVITGNPEEPWEVTFSAEGILLRGPHQQKSVSKGSLILQPDHPYHTIILRDLSVAVGFSWAGFADREVRGSVEIRPVPTGFYVRNLLPMETYLYGVVPAEMPGRFPPEALKVQSVLARSYALFQRDIRKPHRVDGYDICDEQHCQVYGGVALEGERTTVAVDSTRGEYLSYLGKPVHSVYSSNCGGYGQTGSEIGWGSVPYWTGHPDREETHGLALNHRPLYCGPSTFTESVKSEWVRFSLAEDLEERVRRKKDIGDIRSVSVTARGPSHRATELTIRGAKDILVLRKESDIRRILGMASLRSTLFVVDTFFKDDRPSYFLIQGQGWGHGVGFCQSGGAGRAQAGQSYHEILTHYFPETQIKHTQSGEGDGGV
jgi:stage II sporulation protein D